MKLQIPIKDFVNDLFGGFTDLDLMTKYQIFQAIDLYKVFNRLIMMGIVDISDLKERFPQGWKVKWKKEKPAPVKILPDPFESRRVPRHKLYGKVEICDVDSCSEGLEIQDVSELGVMVAPVKVLKNDVRDFVIKPLHLEDVSMISFTAECRWTDGVRAGFRIIDISPTNQRELQKFIKMFSFEVL
jgi:hypothetical protein